MGLQVGYTLSKHHRFAILTYPYGQIQPGSIGGKGQHTDTAGGAAIRYPLQIAAQGLDNGIILVKSPHQVSFAHLKGNVPRLVIEGQAQVQHIFLRRQVIGFFPAHRVQDAERGNVVCAALPGVHR